MRSNITRSLSGLSLTVILTLSLANAQDPGGPPGGQGGPPGGFGGPGGPGGFGPGGPGGFGGPGGQGLIQNEAIQEDLALTDKQKTQIKKLQAALGEKSRQAFQAAREEGLEPQEIMEGMAGLNRESQAAMIKLLDKNQKARLAQLELQREGLLAVAKSEIATKLKLTSPQTKKVKAIVAEMRQAQFQGMPAPPGGGPFDSPAGAAPKTKGATTKKARRAPTVDDGGAEGLGNGDTPPGGGFFGGGVPPGEMPDFNSEEFRAQMTKMMEARKKIREAATAKVGEVLTKDQNTAFEKMLGKPFDFSSLEPAPPGGKPAEAGAAKAEEGTPKADEEMPKKDAPAKAQPKTSTKKGGNR